MYGQCELWLIPVDDYVVYTPESYSYGASMFTTLLQQVQFEVTACSDVYLALSLVPGEQSKATYETGIGVESNMKSFIRSSVAGQAMATAETPNILSCTQSRSAFFNF